MSYEPTNWQTGDVVTSQKLNKLEQGVADAGGGGGVYKVTLAYDEDADDGSYISDKTIAEIIAAYNSGAVVVFDPEGFSPSLARALVTPFGTTIVCDCFGLATGEAGMDGTVAEFTPASESTEKRWNFTEYVFPVTEG